jgi:mRNA-degrading endonuclease RelE of RelBE toxin-antitoxin system
MLQVRYSLAAQATIEEVQRFVEQNKRGLDRQWKEMRRVLVEMLPNEQHALYPRWRLTGDLSNIYRIKLGERGRLFYLASKEKQTVIVLLIELDSRKAGARDDAYEQLRTRIRQGEFDELFAELDLHNH